MTEVGATGSGRGPAGGRTKVGRRILARLVGALAGTIVVTSLAAAPAEAVYASAPQQVWRVNGRVYATVVVGDTVFVGGRFSSAVSPTGQSVARRNVAAFRISDGSLVTGWRADANGSEVRALASDGSSLWVGGWFSSVNGVGRSRLAKVSVSSGAVDTGFNARLNSGVRGLEVRNGFLYAGGHFTSAGGTQVGRLAKLDAGSGSLVRAFAGTADNNVFSLALSPAGDVLYAGGAFTRLNASSRDGIGAVRTDTGATTGPAMQHSARSYLSVDVSDDGSRVYGASTNNTTASWRVSDGRRQWLHRAEGDMQAVHYVDGDVYFGFHEGFAGDFGVKVLRADAWSGALDNAFRPRMTQFWGVFSISSSAQGLVIGGEMNSVAGVPAGNWARFRVL